MLSFRYTNFIFYMEKLLWCAWICESIYMFTDNSSYLAFCNIWVCQQLTTSLFSSKLLFIDVFVRSSLCSFSFPYMEISNPVYIIAGIHQGMQFPRLPGSVLWRRTACNCLSHHLQKKISEKQLHQWQPWCLWKGRGSWEMGKKLLFVLFILFPSDANETY